MVFFSFLFFLIGLLISLLFLLKEIISFFSILNPEKSLLHIYRDRLTNLLDLTFFRKYIFVLIGLSLLSWIFLLHHYNKEEERQQRLEKIREEYEMRELERINQELEEQYNNK